MSDATINGVTVGKGAGNISNNLAIGNQALYSNVSGLKNTAIGTQALVFNDSGIHNTAIGYQ